MLVMFFFVPCNSLYFKVYFVCHECFCLRFLLICIYMEYLFNPITFSLYVFLDLKWVSCREPIFRSCFCIHSVGLHHLVGAFHSFLFKVIINVYVLTFILLLVLHSFISLFTPLPLLFSCNLVGSLVLYLDCFLFSLCVSIVDF